MNWKELDARLDHLISLGLFKLWDIVIWGKIPVPSILRKPCQLEHARLQSTITGANNLQIKIKAPTIKITFPNTA